MGDRHGYLDRVDAGRRLAQELRGRLHWTCLTVRKPGLPSPSKLATGAIPSGGLRVLNEPVLRMADIDEATFQEVESRVDDGLATGSTIRATTRAVRTQGNERKSCGRNPTKEGTLEPRRCRYSWMGTDRGGATHAARRMVKAATQSDGEDRPERRRPDMRDGIRLFALDASRARATQVRPGHRGRSLANPR